jgi:hypothetical protein
MVPSSTRRRRAAADAAGTGEWLVAARSRSGFASGYRSCCQQYWLPAFARREHCAPFFVVAWHCPETAAVEGGAARLEPLAGTAGAAVAARIGGLQTLQGPKRFDASPSAIGIWLRER